MEQGVSDAEDARAEISKKLVRDKVMRQRSIDASEERFKSKSGTWSRLFSCKRRRKKR